VCVRVVKGVVGGLRVMWAGPLFHSQKQSKHDKTHTNTVLAPSLPPFPSPSPFRHGGGSGGSEDVEGVAEEPHVAKGFHHQQPPLLAQASVVGVVVEGGGGWLRKTGSVYQYQGVGTSKQ
jgi:hypothetical protein